MLEIVGVTLKFGGVTALNDVTFSVPEGEVCAVIGPNGAGKTSLFNVMTRLYQPASGSVFFEGEDLLTMRRKNLAGYGVSRSFQNVALCKGMTVLENVLLGAHSQYSGGLVGGMLRLPWVVRSERRATASSMAWLDRLGLADFAAREVASLSYGTTKRVELARALAANPRLLLLDEPAAGLTHSEVAELSVLLGEIRTASNLTIVVVEHHMGFVMGFSHHVVALNFGRVMADGTPAEVGQDPKVVEAYLGTRARE